MVQGRLKSGTFRKVKKVTPGSRTVTHYVKRKPGRAICAETGKKLPGTAHGIPSKIKGNKSSKRPERPYGGFLSSEAMRKRMKEKARNTKL